MTASEAILSAEGLKVELGGTLVLDIPSFSLHENEVLTVVGPNGSGKSTLLLALACLLKPRAGRISCRGEILDSKDAVFRYRRRISMVFQEPLLFDTTVYRNVAAGLTMRHFSRGDSKDRVMKYLRYFQSENLADRAARKLSGGESQRVSLARAFAVEPEIIFLDEPFSALDPATRHDITHDLNRIVRETGITTVMVTHVESEALSMSGRIMVMSGGRIVQSGSPSEVINNPSNEFVAKLVGMETILNGKVLGHADGFLAVSVGGQEIHAVGHARAGDEVKCCIRPESISVRSRDFADSSGGRNVFAGRITRVYSMGPFLKLTLDCGFPLVLFVTRDDFSELGLLEGNEVCASFKPSSVHLIKPDGR